MPQPKAFINNYFYDRMGYMYILLILLLTYLVANAIIGYWLSTKLEGNLPRFKAMAFGTVDKLFTLFTWFIAPVACLFYVWEERTDRMKRLAFEEGKNPYFQYTRPRQYLPWPLDYLATDDNAVDEYFWGMFGMEDISIHEYQDSWWLQYYARVKWVWRNPGYKFGRTFLGFDVKPECKVTKDNIIIGRNVFETIVWENTDGTKAFMLEGSLRVFSLKDIKYGWKAHRGFNRLLIADRVLTLKD